MTVVPVDTMFGVSIDKDVVVVAFETSTSNVGPALKFIVTFASKAFRVTVNLYPLCAGICVVII